MHVHTQICARMHTHPHKHSPCSYGTPKDIENPTHSQPPIGSRRRNNTPSYRTGLIMVNNLRPGVRHPESKPSSSLRFYMVLGGYLIFPTLTLLIDWILNEKKLLHFLVQNSFNSWKNKSEIKGRPNNFDLYDKALVSFFIGSKMFYLMMVRM